MRNYNEHLLYQNQTVRECLAVMEKLGLDAIVFVVDEENKLLGSITDGDLRRGFIKGLDFTTDLLSFVQSKPKYIIRGKYSLSQIINYRKENFRILPVLDSDGKVIKIINFRNQISYLPLDAVLMAGGRGERLRPLTDNLPKPLLMVGDKSIIEHNIDRLRNYGIDDLHISIRYLGEQIKTKFSDGSQKSMRISYVEEDSPLGTAGALANIKSFSHKDILVMNSDLLTDLDFEDFYKFFIEHDADLAVACIPYQVKIPYAVMEMQGDMISGFREKPTYTYYSNGGIYIMKKSVIDFIPPNATFNATDLMAKLLEMGKKVVSYSMVGYWLDIGRHDDFRKAQEDIRHLKL